MRFARTGTLTVVLACVAAPSVAAGQGGYATEPTREQWAGQADALCKEAYKTTVPLFREFYEAGERGRAKKAGRALIRGARLTIELLEEIGGLARPDADAKRIESFVDTATRADRIFIRAGRAFVDRKVERGSRIFRKGAKLSPRIEKLMRPFDFKHC